MDTSTNLVNRLMLRLSGKIPDECLDTVSQEMRVLLHEFDVQPKETALAVYDGYPAAYKVYMVSKRIQALSEKTLYLYKIILEDMLNTIKKDLADITTNDLRIYLYQLKEKRNICDKTVDSRRHALNSFFTWAHNEGYIPLNPMAAIGPIKCEEKEREPFSDEEVELLKDGCRTARESAIVETLFACGCRVSELAGLKKEDIDFHRRKIKLYGKGKKHRTVPINAAAVLALKRYLRERKDIDPHVFVSSRRPYKPLTSEGIEKIVKNIGIHAGVEHVFPHRFRHTFATNALAHGMELVILQAILGHSKSDTTLIYAKIVQDRIDSSYKQCVA